jgi:hypothetical protein
MTTLSLYCTTVPRLLNMPTNTNILRSYSFSTKCSKVGADIMCALYNVWFTPYSGKYHPRVSGLNSHLTVSDLSTTGSHLKGDWKSVNTVCVSGYRQKLFTAKPWYKFEILMPVEYIKNKSRAIVFEDIQNSVFFLTNGTNERVCLCV